MTQAYGMVLSVPGGDAEVPRVAMMKLFQVGSIFVQRHAFDDVLIQYSDSPTEAVDDGLN